MRWISDRLSRLPGGMSNFWIGIGLILVFTVVTIRNAWVCDDAYITFRTIDNFVNGYGLTWNIVERVQTFTHPLWLLLNLLVYSITQEAFFTSIHLSRIVSVAAFTVIIFALSDSWRTSLVAGAALILSKAFIDYSTSGLENPLTHLLLVVFIYIYASRPHSLRTLGLLAVFVSLGVLNRPDTFLLFAPAVAMVFYSMRSWRALAVLALGGIPLIVWETFSVFYYGSFVSNTAYAKLNTGIANSELWRQGGYYYLDSLTRDPLTLIVVLIGMTLPFILRQRRLIPLSLGVLLYFIYVLSIGGDFMSGRYFSAPFLLAVATIAVMRIALRQAVWIATVVAILGLGLVPSTSPVYTTSDYGLTAEEYEYLKSGPGSNVENHHIMDERAFYFPWASWLKSGPGKEMPTHDWANQGRALRGQGPQLVTKSTVGYFGYFAGPYVHVLDNMALGDPLLARLPVDEKEDWIIGHFVREIPEGYIETLISGRNQLADSNLAHFYQKLSYVTQGPLWDRKRMVEAVKLAVGAYYGHLKRYAERKQ